MSLNTPMLLGLDRCPTNIVAVEHRLGPELEYYSIQVRDNGRVRVVVQDILEVEVTASDEAGRTVTREESREYYIVRRHRNRWNATV